jgi:hypothetical protein
MSSHRTTDRHCPTRCAWLPPLSCTAALLLCRRRLVALGCGDSPCRERMWVCPPLLLCTLFCLQGRCARTRHATSVGACHDKAGHALCLALSSYRLQFHSRRPRYRACLVLLFISSLVLASCPRSVKPLPPSRALLPAHATLVALRGESVTMRRSLPS